MRRLAARARDPFVVGVATAIAVLGAGFVVVALSWRGAARTLLVPLQVPYVISGGLAAVGLIAVGVALLDVQAERLADAEERVALDAMIDHASTLLDARHSASR